MRGDASAFWSAVKVVEAQIGKKGIPHWASKTVSCVQDQPTTVTIPFIGRGEFLWIAAMYLIEGAAGAAVMAGTDTIYGGALIELSSVVNEGPWGNQELTPINAVFGRDGVAGDGPRPLPVPYLIEKQDNIKFLVTSKIATSNWTFTLVGARFI